MRSFHYACLIYLILAHAPARCAHAQAAPDTTYLMNTVYVSASRLSFTPASSGRHMAVLDSAAIAQTGAATIAELLDNLPGVHARTRGPHGVQTDLAMAGATFSQVLVLLDGVRVNDPQTGHHTLNLPLGPQDLQRVEIVYGAGSAVHGPDAFGGVVNLVPRDRVQRRVDLSTRWGETGGSDSDVAAVAHATNLRYGWQGDWGALSLSAGKARSDGYRDTTEFDIDRLYAQLRVPLSSGQLKLSGGVEDKAFGAKDFYAPYPSKEWTRVWLCGAQYQHSAAGGRQVVSRALYRRHRDRFVLWRHNPGAYENRHLNELVTLETHATHTLGRGRALFGGELSHQRIDSNSLGQRQQMRSALFAEWSQPFAAWSVSTGTRLDYSDAYSLEISPSLHVARHWQTVRLSVGVGRAFRAPSFTELYYEDPNNVGNPALGAERAWSYEASVQAQLAPHVLLRSLAYARYESGLIDYVRPAQTPPWKAQNLGTIRTLGTLVELSYDGSRIAYPSLRYSWNDKTRTLAEGLDSKYVFTQPRQQLGLRLRHALPAQISAQWQYDFRQRRSADDYGVAQLIVSRPLPHGRVDLRIDNLTNTAYEEVLGVPMPGRWFAIETVLAL